MFVLIISVGTGFAMFLIIVCGVVIPLCFAIFCYFYCRRQNGDRFFVFKRPFNMYVASFVERFLGGGRCGGCFRDKETGGSGRCFKVGKSAAATEKGVVVVEKEKKKQQRTIEILPVELVSCTNNKLVSSSICLNVEH